MKFFFFFYQVKLTKVQTLELVAPSHSPGPRNHEKGGMWYLCVSLCVCVCKCMQSLLSNLWGITRSVELMKAGTVRNTAARRPRDHQRVKHFLPNCPLRQSVPGTVFLVCVWNWVNALLWICCLNLASFVHQVNIFIWMLTLAPPPWQTENF